MNREECSERARLVDDYSRLITEFNDLVESLKAPSPERKEGAWRAAAIARVDSQTAWDALEKHIAEHKCIDVPERTEEWVPAAGSGSVLEKAALAASDVILVTNDDRQFVDLNEAAAHAFGLTRKQMIGRRIDQFVAFAGEREISETLDFFTQGPQSGICEISSPGRQRRFEFRSRANFVPGLHLSILRQVKGAGSAANNLVAALFEELADELPDDPSLETVRTDLLAASRCQDMDKTLRLYLLIRSLIREHGFLQKRLRRAEASKAFGTED